MAAQDNKPRIPSGPRRRIFAGEERPDRVGELLSDDMRSFRDQLRRRLRERRAADLARRNPPGQAAQSPTPSNGSRRGVFAGRGGTGVDRDFERASPFAKRRA